MALADPIPLASSPINRAAEHRTDEAWLGAAMNRDDALFMAFSERKPLMAPGGKSGLHWMGMTALALKPDCPWIFLGTDKQGAPIFAVELPDDYWLGETPVTDGSELQDMRQALAGLSALEGNLAATAASLFQWHRSHAFCSKCGQPSVMAEAGWKRGCVACGTEHFPRTDPVAIMLAHKGDKCLVGRGPGWPKGFYSCLAGFVEPGETPEMAAARELMEEAGIKSRAETAEYLFSQPWPFPSSLMMGVLIEADSEEITIDPKEIEEAKWITREECRAILAGEHPEIFCPPPMAVAHHIMKAWAERD